MSPRPCCRHPLPDRPKQLLRAGDDAARLGPRRRLWVLELKDREFGSGDAHPFNYRRARYGANEAVIITTEKVSSEAKRVFEELSRSSDTGRQTGAQRSTRLSSPVLIEGLS